jgi:hypothetical protein
MLAELTNPLTLNPRPSELDRALQEARRAPSNQPKVVTLGPGVYPTTGIASEYFQLRSNTRVQGAGMFQTVVRLSDVLPDRPRHNGYNVAFSTWFLDQPNVVISDLTIDCNYQALQAEHRKLNLSLRGAHLFGTGCQLRNVRVINCAGRRLLKPGELEETFTLVVGAYQRDAYNLMIDQCVVEQIVPRSYVSAIALMGTAEHKARVIGGVIQRCRVRASPVSNVFGLNLQETVEARFVENYVAGTNRCLSNDTGFNDHLLIEDNFFAPAACGVYLYSSRNALIRNNRFRLSRTMPAVRIGRDAKDALVMNNVVSVGGKRPPESFTAVTIDSRGESRAQESGTRYHYSVK